MFDKIFRTVSGIIAALIVLIVAFPFVVMVSTSLQTMNEIFSPSANLIPDQLLFSNYAEAMQNGNWLRYFYNSFVIVIIVVIISLVINSMAGYVFARIPFRFSKTLFMLILAGFRW